MITTIANLVGGLGLLLIGMSLMTDGLKLTSGNTLRDLLALWTNNRLRGLLSGFLITAVVQSSSAVTVATIGFANAGMLSLERAIWVIFGSNVGTTMTAWIVALVGFQLNIETLALPLVGLGTLLKFTGGRSRRAPLGLALVGFGLLFLGIGVLQTAFEGLARSFVLPDAESLDLLRISLFVLAGFVLTTLVQSSSAAMVLALSAAESGLLPFTAAAAVVIGANLGTTSTAILSVLGATSTAKRVAVSHVAFNLATAVVAVAILNPLLLLGEQLRANSGLDPSPALALAIFHSVFNVLGVLLMWPVSRFLIGFLEERFRTAEETESRPRYLDRTVLALPFIAADALALEVTRINHLAVRAIKQALAPGMKRFNSAAEPRVVRKLAEAVADYVVELNRTQLSPFLSQLITNLMESLQQYLLAVNIAADIATFDGEREQFNREINLALDEFISSVNVHLDQQDLALPAFAESESASYEEVEKTYRVLKLAILRTAAGGEFEMEEVDHMLQYANQIKRACRQVYKATRRLAVARESLQRDVEGNVVPASEPESSQLEKLKETGREMNAAEHEPIAAPAPAGPAEKEDASPLAPQA